MTSLLTLPNTEAPMMLWIHDFCAQIFVKSRPDFVWYVPDGGTRGYKGIRKWII